MYFRATLAAALGLLVAGCGAGEEGAPTGAAADRRAVQERTASYLRAYLSGDGAGACAQFTPAYRRDADRRLRAANSTCAKLLGEVGPGLVARLPADQRRATVARVTDPAKVRVELDGSRATAGFAAAGEGRVPARVELERVGGRWLVSQLGTRARPTP